MGQERLIALVLLNIENEILLDVDKVADDFARNSPNNLQLKYTFIICDTFCDYK